MPKPKTAAADNSKAAQVKPGWVLRPSAERGRSTSNWLETYFTFSFAGYLDNKHEGYGPLRVINEDKIKGGTGFGTHAHDNFEIFTYVLSGWIRHTDSMGNEEEITRGGVQFTSAGKGISHSEVNADPKEDLKVLQIWVKPEKQNLKPAYRTKTFSDADKTNQLCLIVSRDARKGSIKINQHCDVYCSILEPTRQLEQPFELAEGRKGYIHLTMATGGKLTLTQQKQQQQEEEAAPQGAGEGESLTLTPGDGAYLMGPLKFMINSCGKKNAEFLLFDLPPQ